MVKINSLEVENIKRVKAVALEPAASGLTIIGGRNNQGKTSVLDAIAWTLGGGKFRPSNPVREGSVTPPQLKVVLDNGLVVERKGKNSDLKVIDPEGRKSGQALLDGFISELALDLPKFINSSAGEKAKTLLNIIGVGDQLYALEQQEQTLYNQRTGIGQIAKRKHGAADDMPIFPDAPVEPVSATELIQQQQEILAKNGENQQLRLRAEDLVRKQNLLAQQVSDLSAQLESKKFELSTLNEQLDIAIKSVEQLRDESTAEIEESIAAIDEINQKVRTNAAKATAEQEAQELDDQYTDLTAQIEEIRSQKMALLDSADLPLPGLSVDAGELVYNGVKWDGMSSSEQLRVATAIVRRLNPECEFVLMDKLEQLDLQTLTEFGAWAETEGLQVIATRVSTGEECSILIVDGYSRQIPTNFPAVANSSWRTGGRF